MDDTTAGGREMSGGRKRIVEEPRANVAITAPRDEPICQIASICVRRIESRQLTTNFVPWAHPEFGAVSQVSDAFGT